MSRFENAGVAARSRRISRPDLAEQLVRRLAPVNVASRETPRMQRSGFRFADEPFDERAQLLGLGLGCLDRALVDQRRRQIPQQREPLLAGTAELTSRMTMPSHCLTPPCRQARPRQPGSAAC